MSTLSERGIPHAQPEKTEPVSPISPEALMKIIAALGNDESKLITISAMEPGVFYSQTRFQSTLAQRIKTLLGKHTNPYASNTNPMIYCEKSFSPVGIVDKRDDNREFRSNSLGSRMGVALAGHLLSFSEDHPEMSLRKLSGNNSGGYSHAKSEATQGDIETNKKSLETRYEIFHELLTASLPIRMIDLAKALGENPEALKVHVHHLRDNGIVKYESVDPNRPIVLYRSTKLKPTADFYQAQRHPTLTQEVYDLVEQKTSESESSWATIGDINSHSPVRQTGQYKNGKGGNAQRITVLKRLADAGYLTRQKFSGNIRSEISLTEKQRLLINDFTTVIDGFQTQDETFIDEGIRKAREILSNPSRVHELMTKAYENSPNTAPVAIERMKGIIIKAFPQQGEFDTAAFSPLVQELLPKTITNKYLTKLLGMLAEEGTLIRRKDKNTNYWMLAPTQS